MTPLNHLNQPSSTTNYTRIEDLTRREFMFSALGAALLIACGDDDDDSPAAESTRQFTDSTGATVTIPDSPRRIVALGPPQWAAVQVLSLGGAVVGSANFDGTNWPDFISTYFDMAGIEGLGWAEETDVEALIALDPDMIVAPARDRALDEIVGVDPERLKAIAPLVAIDPFRSVEDVMADYAALLGVDTAVLAGQRAEFEGLMTQIHDLLGEGWKDITVASCWPGEEDVEAWGPLDLPMNAIIDRLGVQWAAPSLEAQKDGGYASFSLERLAEFDCDLMLYGTPSWDFDDNPLFQQLKVVQAGQIVRFPDFTYDGTHYPNYIACARHILDALKALPQPLRTDLV